MKRIILALAMLPIVAACTQGAARSEPELGVREARDLAKEIEGKVAGAPQSCISSLDSSKLRVLGDNVVVYRVNKDLVYRGTLEGACRGLAMGDALVMNRPTATQYCRGDIARSVNFPSGMTTGSCAFGDFVPYRTPGK
jgi:hypothetical protein